MREKNYPEQAEIKFSPILPRNPKDVDERIEGYVNCHDNQNPEVKVRKKDSKKKSIQKKAIAIALACGVVFGSAGTMMNTGKNYICNEVKEMNCISDDFYVSLINGGIYNVNTNEELPYDATVMELCAQSDAAGLDRNELAIYLDIKGIPASEVEGSTFLGRVAEEAKAYFAFVNNSSIQKGGKSK